MLERLGCVLEDRTESVYVPYPKSIALPKNIFVIYGFLVRGGDSLGKLLKYQWEARVPKVRGKYISWVYCATDNLEGCSGEHDRFD